jgi:cytosine/adenosine deaminase-related metal-dependent hydrolase
MDFSLPYQPKSDFETEVRDFCNREFGGRIVNFHTHGDRAYTRRDSYYAHIGKSVSELSTATLPEKQKLTWALHNGPAFDPSCIEERMERLVKESLFFGVKELWTTVDITYNSKFKSLEVAEKLKKRYRGKLDIKIGAYNPSGFQKGEEQKGRFELFEEAVMRADFIVGLAEKDRSSDHIGESQHNWYMLRLSYEHSKPVHFHVGQENRPTDNTLELLLHDLSLFQDNYLRVSPENFPEVVAIHAISSSCKSQRVFNQTAKKMVERRVGLICCPRAAVSMLQDYSVVAPTHNSIAKVWDFAVRGVRIRGLGVDNLDDIFVPASSADIYDDSEYLANCLRLYRSRIIAKVLCGQELDPFDIGTIRKHLV